MHASGNRFKIGQQADPMDLMAWLLNALHTALGGTKKQGSSIIHKTFQGTVKVITHKAEGEEVEETETPFLYLTVDVPPAPLFKDALERNIIPQVSRAALRLPPIPSTSPHLPLRVPPSCPPPFPCLPLRCPLSHAHI